MSENFKFPIYVSTSDLSAKIHVIQFATQIGYRDSGAHFFFTLSKLKRING